MRYYTTARISDNIHTTPEGFLLCVGVPIARIGQMIYIEGEVPIESDESGRILIEREEHEVFRQETIASFEGKAVTIGHPADSVTPNNWSRLANGIIQNVRRGTGNTSTDLIADLLITDEAAINRVQSGLREVSCGYDADYIQTEPGRGFQTKIVGNHVALVDEGRAGPAYAINDAKGKTVTTKIADKVKSIIAKAQEDVAALIGAGNTQDGKTGKTGDKSAKDDKAEKDDKEGKDTKDETEGNTGLADLVAMVKALSEKVDAMASNGRATGDDDDAEEGKADDAEGEAAGEGDIMARLEKLEQAVAKLLAREDDADETDVEEEAEDFADGKNEGGAAGSEDSMPKSTYTGDAASRMEILAPGKKFKGKDAKTLALKAAYATADGKKVIDQLTGKKGLTTDNAAQVDMLFITVSELLKQARQDELAGTKRGRVEDSAADDKGPMTPERINEINAKHYGGVKV